MKPLLASPLAFVLAVIAAVAAGVVLPIFLGFPVIGSIGSLRWEGTATMIMVCVLFLSPGFAAMILTARDIKEAVTAPRAPSKRDDDLFTLAWEMSFQYQAARVLFMATPMLLGWTAGLLALARVALPLAETSGWNWNNAEATRVIAIHAALWAGYPVLLRAGILLVMSRVLAGRSASREHLIDSAKKTLLYSLGVALYLAGLGVSMRLMPVSHDTKGMAGYFYVILAVYSLAFAGLLIGALSWWSKRQH